MSISKHWTMDRRDRQQVIQSIGMGKPLFSANIDKGHPAGPELHTITDTGLIIIHNAHTKKLVTILIAGPTQLTKYGKPVPQSVLKLAKAHQEAGLNC